MSIVLPAFQQACLTADHLKSIIYVVGSSSDGVLEVYSADITNVNSPVISLIVTLPNDKVWSASSPKFCFPSPYPISSNLRPNVTAIQFGPQGSYMIALGLNGNVNNASYVPQQPKLTSFVSAKLFAFTKTFTPWDSSDTIGFFNVYTNTTANDSQWAGLRLNLANPFSSTLR
ncbi:hypothetical protein BGX33_001067 [Mortierella sp. NVP41]|nr:hypothetical protein BGX33_001067 [Mortierella sp. NVP41]